MTDAIDITAEQRKTLLALLRQFIPGVAVWAYGSRVKWTARPNSDLDLVAFTTPAQSPLVSELKEALSESNLPFLVDFHVWDEVPERFHEIIRKEYIVLQEEKQPENGSGMAGDALASAGTKSWLYHPMFPEHWERRALYSLAQWVNGLAFRAIQFSLTGKPVIKIAEIKGGVSGQTKFTEQVFDESVHVRSGDLLFSWSGQPETSIDVFWWRGSDGWLNQHSFRVTPVKGIDPTFFFYLLRYLKPSFVGIARNKQTTGLGHVTKRDLENIKAAYPLLPEQRAIAHILGSLDDKIELNRRMNATLEEMVRALYQSWFVDFDPVRAKLDGRKPAGLDAATAALFPDHFQDSLHGHIPQGWEVCPLADKIELLSGGTPKTGEPDYWNGDIPWFSVKDAPTETDVWVIHTEKSVTELGISNSAAQILPEKTTIITARGTVGKLALTGIPMAMNQSCYGVRGITGYADYFTYYSIRAATAQLQQHTHGTVFDTITRQTFETLHCIFPPPKLTAAFDIAVEPLLEQIRANLQQSRTLATLRDALLPKLLSGELSVKQSAMALESA